MNKFLIVICGLEGIENYCSVSDVRSEKVHMCGLYMMTSTAAAKLQKATERSLKVITKV